MVQMNEEWPDDTQPYWMPYFAVEDCDLAVDKAVALGGTVPVPPTDIPPGRFAVVTDPDGAYLSIIRLTG
jgi:predicted enzyme related to lactoylglutathione lyase